MSISLKCRCGAFEGEITEVSHALNKRSVCLCRDCQAFAQYLGYPPGMLDPNGGTEVVPFHPAKIKFTRGIENLNCVRLSSDGMIRWYTQCCKTPIANTMTSAKLPFAGVIHSILVSPDLGPVYARFNGKYGYGTLPPGTLKNASLKIIVNSLRFLATGVIRQLQKPSPFFNAAGKPTVEPTVLSDAQYDDLIAHLHAST